MVDMVSKKTSKIIRGKRRNERPNVGGVSSWSRNDAPSRKGRVVKGRMTRACNQYEPPTPQLTLHANRLHTSRRVALGASKMSAWSVKTRHDPSRHYRQCKNL